MLLEYHRNGDRIYVSMKFVGFCWSHKSVSSSQKYGFAFSAYTYNISKSAENPPDTKLNEKKV